MDSGHLNFAFKPNVFRLKYALSSVEHISESVYIGQDNCHAQVVLIWEKVIQIINSVYWKITTVWLALKGGGEKGSCFVLGTKCIELHVYSYICYFLLL